VQRHGFLIRVGFHLHDHHFTDLQQVLNFLRFRRRPWSVFVVGCRRNPCLLLVVSLSSGRFIRKRKGVVGVMMVVELERR